MSGAHIFSCRNSPNLKNVNHYLTIGYAVSLKDNTNPSVGISQSSLTTINSNLSCNFRVDLKVITDINYQKPYILLAFGSGKSI